MNEHIDPTEETKCPCAKAETGPRSPEQYHERFEDQANNPHIEEPNGKPQKKSVAKALKDPGREQANDGNGRALTDLGHEQKDGGPGSELEDGSSWRQADRTGGKQIVGNARPDSTGRDPNAMHKATQARHIDPNAQHGDGRGEPEVPAGQEGPFVTSPNKRRTNANPGAVDASSPFNRVKDGATAAALQREYDTQLANGLEPSEAVTAAVQKVSGTVDVGGGLTVTFRGDASNSLSPALAKFDAGRCQLQGNNMGTLKGGNKR